MTTADKHEKQAFKEAAISQIEKQFKAAKNVQVGYKKPNSSVHAVRVFDFMPMLKQLINQTCVVVCDDVIEDELPEKRADNNDFMLLTHGK